MKVVGSGSPRMLTIRIKTSEVKLLRDVICDRRADLLTATTGTPPTQRRGGEDRDDSEVDGLHDELYLLARALDDLRRHVPIDQPRVLVGPTWVLDPIIRTAATEAAERLSEAVDVFRADKGQLTADQLRATLDTACASTATLIALDHIQNHGVE